MAETTSGGLPVETPDTATTGGLSGTTSINIGGQKIATKGPIQGESLLKAMEEEYARRTPSSGLGRFNTFLEGMKDAVAITSRDPGTAMASRDQEKRLNQESLFQMRANMASLKGQMGQQALTSAQMNAQPGGAGAQPQAGGEPQAGGVQPQPGGSPAEQMINSLPASLKGQGRRLATEGNWDELSKMVQAMQIHKPEIQKGMEYVSSLPEGADKVRAQKQVLDKTYGTYTYINDKGDEIKYTLGGPNDPALTNTPPVITPPAAAPGAVSAPVTPPGPVAAAPMAAAAAAPMAAKPVAAAPAPVAAAPAPAPAPVAAKPVIPAAQVAATPATSGVGVAPFKAVTPRPGLNDETGLPNTATPGSVQYNAQRDKNAAAATEMQKAAIEKQLEVAAHQAKSDIDVKGEVGKTASKIYGTEYGNLPERKAQAADAIATADRVIAMADDPKYRKLMGYFEGGNMAASALVYGANIFSLGTMKQETLEKAYTALGFSQDERASMNKLKTDASKLGIEYTAQMFKGARLGIGLEKLGSQGKGISAEFTPETNKLFAQITKRNAEFVLAGHKTFMDEWKPAHPGQNWGDYIQSKEYDTMLDNHLAAERKLTAGTPIKVEKISADEASKAAKASKYDKYITTRK